MGRFLLLLLVLLPLGAQAEMRGHGGPVRAAAVSPDGRFAVTGSFDGSAILWSLDRETALAVLRFHEGAVNAVAFLDGRFLTGGEDGRVALWRTGETRPERVIEGHEAAVVGLAVSPDGAFVASASWDGTARVTPLAGGAARVLTGHQGNVNAVAFLPDGRPVTAGYDGTLRIWPKGPGSVPGPSDDAAPTIVTLPTPLNALVTAPDGEIVTAGADGVVRILVNGRLRAATGEGSPVVGLALSPDGARIAAATLGGLLLVDRATGEAGFGLQGAGRPVWSVAFRPGNRELLTGGNDHAVRRWDLATGREIGSPAVTGSDDVLARFKGDRGAEVFRACVACHALTPDSGNRAGPTLHGVFGRRIATAPGYNFSPPLKNLDIVWTAETIARLFELGPSRYTPGTKMPEQIITDPRDREALVRFLERATR